MGNFFSQWSGITANYFVGAISGGLMDWMFGKIPTNNGFFAVLLSTAQLALSLSLSLWMTGLFESNKSLAAKQTAALYYPFMVLTIWSLSPMATSRLIKNYRSLHNVLYGNGRITTGKNCENGKCE